VFLAVIAGGATLNWMQDILTPLALAVFLAVMIDSFARVLTLRAPSFPQELALPTAIVLSIAAVRGVDLDRGRPPTARRSSGRSSEYVASLNAMIAKFAPVVVALAPGGTQGRPDDRRPGQAAEPAALLRRRGPSVQTASPPAPCWC
jgi:AI-2 transport protein TqsA